MKVTALVLWLVCAALPSWAQTDSLIAPADTTAGAIETVRALEEARRKAMVAADTRTLEAIIAAGATYVHSNGLMQTREELFATLERGEIRYVSFTLADVRYREHGGAVVGTGVQRLEVESGGKAMALSSRYTVVYVLGESGAKLVAYQSTATPRTSTQR